MMFFEIFDFCINACRAMVLKICLQKSLRVPSLSVVPLLQTGKYVVYAENHTRASKLPCVQ